MDSIKTLVDKISLRMVMNMVDVDDRTARFFELLIENGCPFDAIMDTFKQLAKEEQNEEN